MKSAFDEIRDDEYAESIEAQTIGSVLVDMVDAHEPLSAATIAFIFRDEEIRDKGKVVAASAHLPRLQGPAAKHWGRFMEWSLVRLLGCVQPDFVILIDRNLWEGLDLSQRVAIIDHELCHTGQARDEEGHLRFNRVTGAPIWEIRGHDLEEFNGVIARHGVAWDETRAEMARVMVEALSAESLMGAEIVEEVERRLATA